MSDAPLRFDLAEEGGRTVALLIGFVTADRCADVVDVVLGEIWGVPRYGAVVGIIMENGQSVVCRT